MTIFFISNLKRQMYVLEDVIKLYFHKEKAIYSFTVKCLFLVFRENSSDMSLRIYPTVTAESP